MMEKMDGLGQGRSKKDRSKLVEKIKPEEENWKIRFSMGKIILYN